jgi:chromosome partitioning protein
MILTIAQQKGGAGKTTLAAQLATAFLAMRKSVATIDIDPQGSLTRWAEVRTQLLGDSNKLVHVQATGWRSSAQAEALARSHNIVIIDSPPHAETDARLSIRIADLVLVPVQPSPMDIWATQATLQLARAERVPTLLVPNRVPARSNMAEGILENLSQLGSAVSRLHLGSRVAYAESMLSGKGVIETHPLSTAADEMAAMAREVIRHTSVQQRKAAA